LSRVEYTYSLRLLVRPEEAYKEQNKALVHRFFEEFSTTVVDELFVPNYTHHDSGLPPELQHGRDAYKQLVTMFHTGFPDLKMNVEDLVSEGEKVVARWTWSGTNQGEFQGIPPTGKQVTGSGISIHRIADGKIAEAWVNFDALGMLQQLGVIPSMG
jgi:steroid delta-isomerase-like uncharacterized protein